MFSNPGPCFRAVALPPASLRIPGIDGVLKLREQPPSCFPSRNLPSSAATDGPDREQHIGGVPCGNFCLPTQPPPSPPTTACWHPLFPGPSLAQPLLLLLLSPFIRVLSPSTVCLSPCGHLLCLGFFSPSCVPRMAFSFVPQNVLCPPASHWRHSMLCWVTVSCRE